VNFQGEAVVGGANGSAEGDASRIVTQNIHHNPLILWPHLGEQNLHALATNAETALMALHEELSQVEMVFTFPVKGMGQDAWVIFKKEAR
jgi:hypothetical protein